MKRILLLGGISILGAAGLSHAVATQMGQRAARPARHAFEPISHVVAQPVASQPIATDWLHTGGCCPRSAEPLIALNEPEETFRADVADADDPFGLSPPQSEAALDAVEAPPRTQWEEAPVGSETAHAISEAEAPVDVEALRAEYIELLRRKAELTANEKLPVALEGIKREIVELEARKEMEEAAAELQDITTKYPGTWAASAAKEMLRVKRTHAGANATFAPPIPQY